MAKKIQLYVEKTNPEGNLFLASSPPLMKLNKKAIPPLKQSAQLARTSGLESYSATFIFHDLVILYFFIKEGETALFIHHTCDIEKEMERNPLLIEYRDKITEAVKTIKSEYKSKDFQFVHFQFVYPQDLHKFYVN